MRGLNSKVELRQESLEMRMKERYQVMVTEVVQGIEEMERPGDEEHGPRLEALERMGDVNLVAIDEFESVEERIASTTQREDLLEALSDLEKAISEIDRTSKSLFKKLLRL